MINEPVASLAVSISPEVGGLGEYAHGGSGRRVCVPQTMTSIERHSGAAPVRGAAVTNRDQDIHKGAIEDGRPSATTNAPGLDDEGLPNDETRIAADALGAREDGTQG